MTSVYPCELFKQAFVGRRIYLSNQSTFYSAPYAGLTA